VFVAHTYTHSRTMCVRLRSCALHRDYVCSLVQASFSTCLAVLRLCSQTAVQPDSCAARQLCSQTALLDLPPGMPQLALPQAWHHRLHSSSLLNVNARVCCTHCCLSFHHSYLLPHIRPAQQPSMDLDQYPTHLVQLRRENSVFSMRLHTL